MTLVSDTLSSRFPPSSRSDERALPSLAVECREPARAAGKRSGPDVKPSLLLRAERLPKFLHEANYLIGVQFHSPNAGYRPRVRMSACGTSPPKNQFGLAAEIPPRATVDAKIGHNRQKLRVERPCPARPSSAPFDPNQLFLLTPGDRLDGEANDRSSDLSPLRKGIAQATFSERKRG